MFNAKKILIAGLLAAGPLLGASAQADDTHPFATHHYVIQVSQDDPALWNLAMNNAQNLENHYGPDKVEVVVVAYGPGLKMLLADSPAAARITAQTTSGIEFDACENTMKGMAKKSGHMPKMNPSVKVVPAGVVRIGELEEQGFSYIKP